MNAAAVPQHGFSLIEAMVSLVVLSVGMMGIAAMYGQGLAAGRTAQFRTQAVNLASDMADRSRVNRLAQAAYSGAAADNQCDPQTGGGVSCAPAQMAAHDLFVWEEQVGRLLPNGEASVDFDGTTVPATYTIEISWDEVGEGQLMHALVIQVPNL